MEGKRHSSEEVCKLRVHVQASERSLDHTQTTPQLTCTSFVRHTVSQFCSCALPNLLSQSPSLRAPSFYLCFSGTAALPYRSREW